MAFSSEIKEIRQKCYLSQQDFADKIGVSFSTVNRWEKAKAIPNYQTMKRLLAYFKQVGVDYKELEHQWRKSTSYGADKGEL